MRNENLKVYRVDLPFRFEFPHSLRRRVSAANIVVEVDAEGRSIRGYGEGAPRTYVTGESQLSACRSVVGFSQERHFPWHLDDVGQVWPFYIAIASILCVIWVSAVIVGPVAQGSLLLIFAIYALHKIVEHNAGSSSGSPYGKLSCVRAVFSAAAEVPLFAVLIIIYLKTGDHGSPDITAFQAQNGALLFTIPLAALMFFVLILSKAPYSPFAITKGKDIVSGYETEHFGLLRGYLMISESIAWYMLLWIFLTVFLGPLSLLGYLVGMVVISVIVAFINATTPMLNPNHSIMVQAPRAPPKRC